jgi:hypothetical protein
MQKRGGGRFGKYGDLKRKEKIRQTRVLKCNGKVKPGAQCAEEHRRQTERLLKLNIHGAVGEMPRLDKKPNGEDENS